MKSNILKNLAAGFLGLACAAILISCNSPKETKENRQPVIPVKVGTPVQEQNSEPQQKWTEVPAIKDEYKKYFDYFGFAVPENQLTNDSIMKGISWHD